MSPPAADRARSLPPRVVSWWLLIVPGLLGTAIGIVVRGDRNFRGDLAILETIQRFDWPGVDALVALSNLVFSTGGGVVLGLLLLGAAGVMHRVDLVVQLGVLVLLRVAGTGLKPVFDSPRPEITYQQDPSLVSDTLGYPSGHAYTATVIASMLIVLVSVLGPSRPARWAIAIGAALVTLLALVARIHIGAHWPSDTVGGVLFGLATIGAMQLIVDWLATPDAGAAWRRAALGPTPAEPSDRRDRDR